MSVEDLPNDPFSKGKAPYHRTVSPPDTCKPRNNPTGQLFKTSEVSAVHRVSSSQNAVASTKDVKWVELLLDT